MPVKDKQGGTSAGRLQTTVWIGHLCEERRKAGRFGRKNLRQVYCTRSWINLLIQVCRKEAPGGSHRMKWD